MVGYLHRHANISLGSPFSKGVDIYQNSSLLIQDQILNKVNLGPLIVLDIFRLIQVKGTWNQCSAWNYDLRIQPIDNLEADRSYISLSLQANQKLTYTCVHAYTICCKFG